MVAYQRKRLADHEVIDLNTLDLPEQNFVTQALWYELGDERGRLSAAQSLLGALHATEHSQIAVLPLIAMCDRWDIGGLSTNYPPPDRLSRRSSSTTATPAESGSRGAATRSSSASSATRAA